ncbi:MAG: hypothetical protein V3T29_08620, partial [Alphaproteobacteria bacterium]
MTTDPPGKADGVARDARKADHADDPEVTTGASRKGTAPRAARTEAERGAMAALAARLERTQEAMGRFSRRLAALERNAAPSGAPATPLGRAAPALSAALAVAALVVAGTALLFALGGGSRDPGPERAAVVEGERGIV